MICQNCKNNLQGDFKFCPSCGAPVTQKPFCPGCGKEFEQTTKRKRYCTKTCYINHYKRTHGKNKPLPRTVGKMAYPKNWRSVIVPEVHSVLSAISAHYQTQQYLTTTFCLDYITEKHPVLRSYGKPEQKRFIVFYLQELGWYNRNNGSKAAVMVNPNADMKQGGIIYA